MIGDDNDIHDSRLVPCEGANGDCRTRDGDERWRHHPECCARDWRNDPGPITLPAVAAFALALTRMARAERGPGAELNAAEKASIRTFEREERRRERGQRDR